MCARETVEAGLRAHALSQRQLAGAADHGAVGKWVGEREPELDDVRSALGGRRRQLGRRLTGHQVDDERLHSRSGATIANSVASTRVPPWRSSLRLTPSRSKPARSRTRSEATLPSRTCASTRTTPREWESSTSMRTARVATPRLRASTNSQYPSSTV